MLVQRARSSQLHAVDGHSYCRRLDEQKIIVGGVLERVLNLDGWAWADLLGLIFRLSQQQ